MCKCTPNIRTPFCGRTGCEWPVQINSPVDYLVNALEGIKADGTDHPQIEMHRGIATGALERYRAAQFPRELPRDAVLVDAAECRIFNLPDTVPAQPMQSRVPLNRWPKGHHPVEFGPSDDRRLECACGNPDPAHARPAWVEDLPACGP